MRHIIIITQSRDKSIIQQMDQDYDQSKQTKHRIKGEKHSSPELCGLVTWSVVGLSL